jgi:TolA-binding protein
MKRTERHQLKENAVAQVVARIRETLESRKREVVLTLVGVVIVVGGIGGYIYWRQHAEGVSRTMLAEAMAVAEAPVVPPAPTPVPGAPATPATPAQPAAPPAGSFPTDRAKWEAALPKFMAVANIYPAAPAGITARYEAAGALLALGKSKEAAERYQEVIDRAGDSLYGDTARLGLAEAQIVAGQFDQAIANYKTLMAKKDGKLPVDGVLMQLGRAYLQAGKTADAAQTFKRLADEFPQSSYAPLAKKELEAAQKP